jgi:hypothetical protein
MKFRFLNAVLISFIMFVSSVSTVNASLININNDFDVGALTLEKDFLSFYDYNTKNKWSSNTGYEQNNTIVMFFAEFNNELALFTLLDSFGKGNAGKGAMSINDINDFGSILFKDDSSDVNISNGVSWKWGAGKNDGMIFKINNPNNFYLDINFSGLSGLNNGIKFLSFSNQSSPTEQLIGRSVTAQVPEPSTLAILGLGMIGLASRRFLQQF